MTIRHFIILGASGDMASRLLFPALARLRETDHLPGNLKITGIGSTDLDTKAFRKQTAERLQQTAGDADEAARQSILDATDYFKRDVRDGKQLAQTIGKLDEPAVAYLALPQSLFAPAIQALGSMELPEESRIVVEKPFGQDLQSARELNRILHKFFSEKNVFRMDHFLGKQTIQNVLGIRFGNRVFEPLWRRSHVEKVEIRWDETLALEGRSAFYDKAGALLDMIQSHLLQLLALVAMEAPLRLDEHSLRDRKADALRAVRRLSPEEVKQHTVRARYTAGKVNGRAIPNYVDEKGIDASRKTETFAQVTLFIDDWRWAGVPFTLRSGKALGKDHREISIHFQQVPHLAFEQKHRPQPNVLRIQLSPDRLALEMNINDRTEPFVLEPITLDADLAGAKLHAYGKLLLDVLEGNPTFSIRFDEAEESWRIVEPIMQAWRGNQVPLLEYAAGSDGPKAGAQTAGAAG